MKRDNHSGDYYCGNCAREPAVIVNKGDGERCNKCGSFLIDYESVSEELTRKEVARLRLAFQLVDSIHHERFEDNEIAEPIRRCFGLLDSAYGRATDKYDDALLEGEIKESDVLPDDWLADSIREWE